MRGHDAHLDTILELPAGWGTAYLKRLMYVKLKILQGHTCTGGIDVGVVIGGTPAKIDEYMKELLGEMMPGGGFILANVNNLPRETPIEISAQFMRLWKSTVSIKNICLGKVVISLEAQN